MKTVEVDEHFVGFSTKELLKAFLIPKRVRGRLRQARRIKVNGRYQPISTVLALGDRIEMHFESADFITAQSSYVPDQSQRPQIIYENEDLLIVNKPRDVKTHPNSPGETGTMLNFVQGYLQEQAGAASAYMVHRLDSATTGALLVAKNPVVVPILNQQLRDKTLQRTYLAWVDGLFDEAQGVIELPIGIDPDDDRKRMVGGTLPLAARTRWIKIHQVLDHTLVRIELASGRTHQIRVHFAAIGHPLVGDQLYNLTESYPAGLLLHAAALKLVLPFSDQTVSLAAALPDDFPRNLKEF